MTKFNTYYGDFNKWLSNLKEKQRSVFLKVIQENKKDPRLAKMNELGFG